MRWKSANAYLIITWILVYAICHYTNIRIDIEVPFMVTVMPVIIILCSFLFGIIYIRNTPENQAFEGFILGIYFILGFIVLDGISFLLFGSFFKSPIQYFSQVAINCIWFPIVFTSLGYAADFKIDLH